MTAGKVTLGTGTAPGTPATGKAVIYFKSSDKKPYFKDDAGTETPFALDGVVGPSNAVYVDLAGSDGSGARGDASKPFLTIKAGLAACQSGDVLLIGPGTYTIAAPADVPVWPAGVDKLTIVGAGHDVLGGGGTVILNTANDGSHIFEPPNTADYIEIRSLYASVTAGTGRALFCDGTGGGGNFLGSSTFSGALVLSDCTLTGAVNSVTLQYVNVCWATNVVFAIGSGLFECLTSNVLAADHCSFDTVQIAWDESSGHKPSIGQLETKYTDCTMGDIELSQEPSVRFAYCKLGDITGNGLTATGGIAPEVQCFYCELDAVDFFSAGAEFPDTATSKQCAFEHCHINTSLKLKVAGVPANRLSATARACVLPSGANTVESGNGVDLDARGNTEQIDGSHLQTSGSGTLLVSHVHILHNTTPLTVTPEVDTVNLPFTATSAPTSVMITPSNYLLQPVACASRTATALTVEYANGITAEMDILCSW